MTFKIFFFNKLIARETLRTSIIQVLSRRSKGWCSESPKEAFPKWAVLSNSSLGMSRRA